MNRIFLIATLCAAGIIAASCGGTNPVTGDDAAADAGDTTTDPATEVNGVPAELAKNMTRISYNAATDELTIELKSLDDPVSFATYNRNAAFDVPGYSAFSIQADPLDRMFVAYGNSSADGSVQAAVVGDGGQFNRFFSGGYYERTGDDTLPTSGLVSYAGTYAGVTNLQHPNPSSVGTLAVPAGTDPSLEPGTPATTSGSVFLNVDFTDNTLNGAIYDRAYVAVPTGHAGALQSLALIVSDIDGNGEFLGDVEFLGQPDEGKQGSYGGIIGGTDGSSIAGVVALDNIYLPSDARDSDFDAEIGVFVLDGCHTAAAAASCP